ncbi:MAG: GC-type dockerin domain-anchored protein [Phycisphaerales bacterium]
MKMGFVFAAGLAAGCSACFGQSSFLWTGDALSGDWDDEQNWSNLSMGGIVSGFPSLIDDALFQSSAAVGGGEALNIAIDPSSTLTIGEGGSLASLTLAGTLTNNGTLAYSLDNLNHSGGVVDHRLYIPVGSSAAIVGTGVVVFNGSETGVQGAGRLDSALTISGDQTVSGNGVFEDLTVVNNGSVLFGGGDLLVNDTDLSGGNIAIDSDGVLVLDGASVVQGTILTGTAGSRVVADGTTNILRDITSDGDILLGRGSRSSVVIDGVLTNNGTLTFHEDDLNHASGIVDQRMFVADGTSATIAGSGSVVFNGDETGIEGEGAASTLIVGPDQTVTGDGVIEDISIENQGSISPGGGDLQLNNTDINGGSIEIAADGVLALDGGSTVHDTLVSGVAGSVVFANDAEDILRDISTEGDILLGRGSRSSVTIDGVLNNNGTLTFHEDNLNHASGIVDQRLFVADGTGATIAGSGSVVFNGDETGIEGEGAASTLIVGPDQTLAGKGVIEDISVENQGLIVPAGGDMIVNNSDLGGGEIDIASDGVLVLDGGSVVQDTMVSGVAGSVIFANGNGDILRDIDTEGDILLGRGPRSSATIEGVITNNGTLTFHEDNANHASGIVDQRLFIGADQSATLVGSGIVVFNGSETGIQGDGNSVLIHEDGHTITGTGAFENISIMNNGTIDPSGIDRRIRLAGDGSGIVLEASGRLVADLGGTDEEMHDALELGSGTAVELGGTLQIRLDDGYIPVFGDTWDIISGGSISGLFDGVEVADASLGQVYRVIYQPSRVFVILTCDGDLTGDGGIDFFDLSLFLSYFGSGDVRGDLNDDGQFNFFDISLFLQIFVQGCDK